MEDFGFSSEIITAASTTITASTTRSTTASLIEHSPADFNRHYLYTLKINKMVVTFLLRIRMDQNPSLDFHLHKESS